MRVYWMDKGKVKYHNAFNLDTAIQLTCALKQCGVSSIWIERELAHRI